MGKDTDENKADDSLEFFEPAPRIAPLETEYAGAKFRSRTEAKWAVFFDALGVRWVYEPEAYELESGRYLVDFWLPSLDVYLEVKGVYPTPMETTKALDLAEHTGKRVVIFAGEPQSWRFDLAAGAGGVMCRPKRGSVPDDGYFFCVCPECGKLGIEWNGYGDRVCGKACMAERHLTGDAPAIVMAARKACGSRHWEGDPTP